MSGYGVDLGQLDDLVTRMAHFERDLDGVREDVAARVQRVHTVWGGPAATANAAAHAQWDVATREMHEALAALRKVARTAHGNYSAAARANTQMWRVT